VGHRGFERFAWIVVGFNVLVGVEGAFVRATGSGAGCGNHWPLCNGEVVVGTPAMAKVIEFAHRSMTGIDSLMVLAMLIWAFRAFPAGHAARFGAVMSSIFLLTEALIGAALVLFGLVTNNASPARAVVLSVHLANTLTLLGFVALTAWWAGGRARIRPSGVAWVSLVLTVLLGITGALAALADTLYPVHSLAAGLAQDLNRDSHFIVKLRSIHPFFAVGVGGWLVWFARGRGGTLVTVIVVVQILAGVLNLLLLVPIGMQLVHLLLAYVLWIALVVLCWTWDGRIEVNT